MTLCNHPWAVSFNSANGVVQCHVCGHVWVPLAGEGEPYRLAVKAEEERLKTAEPAGEVREWLHPADYRKETLQRAGQILAGDILRAIVNNPCRDCQRSGAACHVCEHGGP